LIYRYVLHLEAPDGRHTLRWTFTHPVTESQTLEIPTFGRWYVERAVTDSEPNSGVLYCKPA
jgi:hypothetical protein